MSNYCIPNSLRATIKHLENKTMKKRSKVYGVY